MTTDSAVVAAPVVPAAQTVNHEVKFQGNIDKLAQEAIEMLERNNERDARSRSYSLPTSLWGLLLVLWVERPEEMSKILPPGSLLVQNLVTQIHMAATAEAKEKELKAMHNIRQMESGRSPSPNYRGNNPRPPVSRPPEIQQNAPPLTTSLKDLDKTGALAKIAKLLHDNPEVIQQQESKAV